MTLLEESLLPWAQSKPVQFKRLLGVMLDLATLGGGWADRSRAPGILQRLLPSLDESLREKLRVFIEQQEANFSKKDGA